MEREFKRVVCIADLHCGHRVGLTPPEWQSDAPGGKYALIQSELWNAYAGWIDALKPIDFLFVNGDAVDGKGARSGGTELITSDRTKQIQMAYDCITYTGCKSIVMTYGTPYHTGDDEDWEFVLADTINALAIKSHEWPSIDGIVFDLKHQAAGASNIPYGRGGPLGKDKLANIMWGEYDAQPQADIFIRSHTHACFSVSEPHWIGIFTPALQGAGTKFGGRRCYGRVDFGVTVFDIYPGENLQDRVHWSWKTVFVQSQKSGVLELSLCQSQQNSINSVSPAESGYPQHQNIFQYDQIVPI